VLREGFVPVHVGEQRDLLLTIRDGDMPWTEVESLRIALHRDFEQAYAETRLPDRPNYEQANALLVRARRAAIAEELP
jgi:hypothetical protein